MVRQFISYMLSSYPIFPYVQHTGMVPNSKCVKPSVWVYEPGCCIQMPVGIYTKSSPTFSSTNIKYGD